jgi:hypothetical protein
MRPRHVAVLVLLLSAGLTASPAYGARSVEVQISAHLRSDYRFTYDWVDRSDPDCPQTIKASSRVITDMPTVRPARFRVTRIGRILTLQKHMGRRQRADRAIDMRADMTRTTEGGSETPCYGYEPYSTQRCGSRSWAIDGLPQMGFGELNISLGVPAFPSIEASMKDDEWRHGGCGYDSTQADEYITVSEDNDGRVKSGYRAPFPARRLFRPGRRTLHLRDTHDYVSGRPDQWGGEVRETRTVEVTIRKLR